jgi:hypothetical protein
MSLLAGSVSVDDDGVVTEDGLAAVLFDGMMAMPSTITAIGQMTAVVAQLTAARDVAPTDETRAALQAQIDAIGDPTTKVKKMLVDLPNAWAPAIVNYLTTNAVVTTYVTTSDAGLQRYGGVNTSAPSEQKSLGGTLA